jgi:hypothetical protein
MTGPATDVQLERVATIARATERERLTSRIRDEAALVEDLAARLRGASARLHRARLELAELDQSAPDTGSGNDLAALRRLPGVADVVVADDGVVLTTAPLTISHGSAGYDVGRFSIALSAAEGVHVNAVEPRSAPSIAWIHPHVQEDRPCLGNLRVGIEKLIGTGEFVAAAQVMLGFLESYDPASAYCQVEGWPAREGVA